MAENPSTPAIPATPAPRQTNRSPIASIPPEADLGQIAADMQRSRTAQDSGTYPDLLAEVAPQPNPLAQLQAPSVDPQAIVSGVEQLIAARPAELASVPAPVGLTERGWSTEVTARHPDLLASAMAELAAAGTVGTSDPVDPTDPVALAQAQERLGFAEVIKNNLQVAAANLNGERLAAAENALLAASEAVQAAVHEAVEGAHARADAIRARREASGAARK